MKKIKKECMKNMIAGPGLLQEEQLKKVKLHKQSYSNQKKLESLASQTKKHKNSAVYSHPTYNSDQEDSKLSEPKGKQEFNREVKHWR